MKKTLFVSIAFPPKNDPECLQAGRYHKYMLRSGMDVTVVTSSIPTLYMPYDSTLASYCATSDKSIEIPIFETKLLNLALRKFTGGINFPDSKFSFHLQWKKVVRESKFAPDIIYTRSNPISSALLGFRLQQYYQVPWVMHLSDPWSGSPVNQYTAKESRWNEKWEQTCFQTATRIAVTTQQTFDFYASKYRTLREKLFVSPNVFDPEDMNTLEPDPQGKLKIVYTGGLAGNRSADYFLGACRQVVAADQRLANADIIFAGPIDRANKKIIDESRLPFVRHIGGLSYRDSIALQRQAHVLLCIDEQLSDKSKGMFFPSKLLDYFLARRKILALTNSGSSTSTILESYDAKVIHYPEKDTLINFLVDALNAYQRKDKDFFVQKRFPDGFSAALNAVKLVSLFDSL